MVVGVVVVVILVVMVACKRGSLKRQTHTHMRTHTHAHTDEATREVRGEESVRESERERKAQRVGSIKPKEKVKVEGGKQPMKLQPNQVEHPLETHTKFIFSKTVLVFG